MEFGIYIHYPYCRRVCPFCDFVVRKKGKGAAAQRADSDYVAALLQELQMQAPKFQNQQLVSIYLGGGTPSLLAPMLTQKLLTAIRQQFDSKQVSEITLEVDPTTATIEQLRQWRDLGVNRLSLGIQSLDDRLLQTLGREYAVAQAIELIETAIAAQIPHLSADVLYGVPGQSRADLETTLARLVGYETIQHLSLYNLTVEAGGRFIKKISRESLSMPDEESQVEHLMAAMEFLAPKQFVHYENTAWARRGFQAVHNSGYWLQRSYLGIGVGAHSYLRTPTASSDGVAASWPWLDTCQRWGNGRSLPVYLHRLNEGVLPSVEFEELTPSERLIEFFMLRLRLRQGIARQALESFLLAAPSRYGELIERYLESGHMQWQENSLSLSTAGMLLSNEIFSEFFLTHG